MEKRKQRQINERSSKKQTKKSIKKHPGEISVFTIFFTLIIIAAVIGLYFGVRYIVITLKYKQYTDKMNTYGFNELYNNSKATATQELTNSELIKVIVGSLNNTKDISNIYNLATDEVSDLQNWQNYSTYIGINNIITDSELNNKATKIEAAILLARTIEGILNVEIEQTELKMDKSKLSKYSSEQQVDISKAVTLGIINNKNSGLSESTILKGELNKLIVQLVEKYATIYYKNSNINKDQQQVNIVTDKDKLPSNYQDYPYVIDAISKEEYEQEFNVISESRFRTPKEVYQTMGYLYSQTDYLLTKYFNGILNIDYETITTKSFLQNIANEVVYSLEEKDVESYVQYVKENRIKLEGNATPLLPIMYNTGENLVVRTKITFKVVSSDTEYNLLFGDENNKVKYNGSEITMYVDVPTGMTFNSNSLLVHINCLAKNLSKHTTSVVVE